MNVTLRQLRAFVALAEASSFTDAATSLHVTQSALSGLIKELEQTLGVQVVNRSTRKVQLVRSRARVLSAGGAPCRTWMARWTPLPTSRRSSAAWCALRHRN